MFAGVGERTREGNDLWLEMQETKIGDAADAKSVLESSAMVFGQMNEPPGARLRVALSALTMAEWFRDATGADTLLFVDNIFRFSQAGSEVSALLGPHAERRRLPADAGHGDGRACRNASPRRAKGAITSVQAVYVPADDPTDPAPANTFQHLDAFIYLERSISEKGIYPAVDPLASNSRLLDPQYRRRGALRRRPPGAADPAALPRTAGHHRHPRRRGVERRRQAGRGPGPPHRAVPVAAVHRGRGVHRQGRARSRRSRTRSAASRSCATASGTTCPKARSCTSARSKRPSRGREAAKKVGGK